MCTYNIYAIENKEENYLEIYIFQVSCPFFFISFKHPKLPISRSAANCTYLHDTYISKLEFINYLFANC